MDDLLRLPPPEQRVYIEEAAAVLGTGPAIVEKDFWVCWTLRELFRLPDWGEHLMFKGGTSLSKGWRLIQRFSEDIDIVIGRQRLGFPGDHSLGNKQLRRLRDVCAEVVQRDIAAGLGRVLQSSEGTGGVDLRPDPADRDGQTLLLSYQGLFTSRESYLRPIVKIELGARSDTWPSEKIAIRTMLSEALPQVSEDSAVMVPALSPVRTFWEKAMLLHEENFRPADKKRQGRLARHYYDLWCLLRSGIGEKAAQDQALFDSVADHRRIFFRQTWVNYDTLRRGSLVILPRPETMRDWEADYEAMGSYLFPGEAPSWSSIIDAICDFQERFNSPVA